MKRTALVRRTPLLAKKPWRTWRRAEEDKVPPELAEYIFARDRICLQFRVEGDAHQCRNRWGEPHAPDDRRHLRIAHVKSQPRLGVRAEPDARHLVVECDLANERWSSANRDIERDYLRKKEP